MKKTFLTLLVLSLSVLCMAQTIVDPSLQREMSHRGNDEKISIGIIMHFFICFIF